MTWTDASRRPPRHVGSPRASGAPRRAGGRRRAERRAAPRDAPARPTPAAPADGPADARDRRHHAVPGDGRGAARGRASRAGSSSAGWRPSGSTTCGSGASAGTGPSTTRRTAAAPGMVLRVDVAAAAIDAVRRADSTGHPPRSGGRAVPPGPSAHDLAARPHLVFLCPRYEGVDDRIRAAGRPRALDRRLRAHRRGAAGARGHRRGPAAAARARSTPHRPPRSRSPTGCWSTRSTRALPSSGARACRRSSSSGHHAEVAKWRHEESLRRTRERRPDLLDRGGRALVRGAGRRHRPGRVLSSAVGRAARRAARRPNDASSAAAAAAHDRGPVP